MRNKKETKRKRIIKVLICTAITWSVVIFLAEKVARVKPRSIAEIIFFLVIGIPLHYFLQKKQMRYIDEKRKQSK